MDTLVQDLRFAVRSLVRRPGFSVTAIATLALGIGATTAIFSVVNAVIMRPLPFPDSERLVEDTVRTLTRHKLAPVAKLAAERQCATTH